MKINTATRPHLLAFLAFASVLAVAAPGADTSEGKTTVHGKMLAGCETMMVEKKEMMSAMKAADTALTARVAAMNAAPAGQKSELMANIVTSLVEQRTAQNVQAGKMQEKMMTHMMGHMEMGQDSMASCPMMKRMDENSSKPHREQDANKK